MLKPFKGIGGSRFNVPGSTFQNSFRTLNLELWHLRLRSRRTAHIVVISECSALAANLETGKEE